MPGRWECAPYCRRNIERGKYVRSCVQKGTPPKNPGKCIRNFGNICHQIREFRQNRIIPLEQRVHSTREFAEFFGARMCLPSIMTFPPIENRFAAVSMLHYHSSQTFLLSSSVLHLVPFPMIHFISICLLIRARSIFEHSATSPGRISP